MKSGVDSGRQSGLIRKKVEDFKTQMPRFRGTIDLIELPRMEGVAKTEVGVGISLSA